jgi:iron complex outermembrane recepter protein
MRPCVPILRQYRRNFLAVTGLCLGLARGLAAPTLDFTELTLEELGTLSISAAAKRAQPLFETPAAVSVILPVDIRRTGHATAAEALRLVPGAQVSQSLPSRWNIGIRGFNGLTSSKLLVLVDGRSVYSPFYGSVEWTNVDVPLDDLDRIEVVRGPGATLWGANAVNGIVNVISKHTRDTLGGVVNLRLGTAEAASAHVRYGDELSSRSWFRVYATASETEWALGSIRNEPLADFRHHRAGFRTDLLLDERFNLSWQAEYLERARTVDTGPADYRLASILGRLDGATLAGGRFQLQLYIDSSRNRAQILGGATPRFPLANNEKSLNVDLDFTHTFQPFDRHSVTWGGGIRRMDSEVTPSPGMSVARQRDLQGLYNLFLQDEITLWDERWRLILGSKLEYHETIGLQPQPNVRLVWLPLPQHALWGAVSYAVRAPSRAEREVFLQLAPIMQPPLPIPVRPELVGNPAYSEERLTAFELGWRWRPSARFSTDLTAYYFEYDDLRSLQVVAWYVEFQPTPVYVLRNTTMNAGRADSHGAEATAQWRVRDGWELSVGLTYAKIEDNGVSNDRFLAPDFAIPRWTTQVRSWWDLPGDFEFSLSGYGMTSNPLAREPQRFRFDGQLIWHPRPDLDLTLGVHRLNESRVPDVNMKDLLPMIEQRRSIYLQMRWRF